ncbi:MAG: YihY/virulence factor BrkB family protein [Gaiellaceae bacterium]
MRPESARSTPREWLGIFRRAFFATRRDNIPMIASALAYSSFFAIPAVALLAIGTFALFASPATIEQLMHNFQAVMPAQATDLLGGSLQRLERRHGESALIVALGGALALWSTTSAMSTYMTGLNIAYASTERRGFVRRRLIALAMVAFIGAAVALTTGLLIFGPLIERHLGSALGIQGVLKYVWWAAQWPILVAGLLAAFEILYRLGPDLELPQRLFSAGSLVAVAVWLAASGALAVYTATFGSYNKTWGTLSAVIVTLLWLWLSGLALLFGAELNAELGRSRNANSPDRGRSST